MYHGIREIFAVRCLALQNMYHGIREIFAVRCLAYICFLCVFCDPVINSRVCHLVGCMLVMLCSLLGVPLCKYLSECSVIIRPLGVLPALRSITFRFINLLFFCFFSVGSSVV